ncbi:jg7536 [Pararge aegeria aegeria]|uniref:Jg7536 protein n=1 Tax=Pararge aegeria aegeria TaxID=348720 RepID=A0A8S4QUH1_9NEOP|nr:jg7536 [Pararge aegeria aegeria]
MIVTLEIIQMSKIVKIQLAGPTASAAMLNPVWFALPDAMATKSVTLARTNTIALMNATMSATEFAYKIFKYATERQTVRMDPMKMTALIAMGQMTSDVKTVNAYLLPNIATTFKNVTMVATNSTVIRQ